MLAGNGSAMPGLAAHRASNVANQRSLLASLRPFAIVAQINTATELTVAEAAARFPVR